MTDQPHAAQQPRAPGDEPPEEVLVRPTAPVGGPEKLLREKFYERYANQADRMDALAGQMITVELAVPGLYAALLKLLQGEDAVLPGGGLVWFTFASWFAALLLTFLALFPRRYDVDPTIIRGDPAGRDKVLGLEAFFSTSARRKWWLLAAAAVVFWAGVVGAFLLLFG